MRERRGETLRRERSRRRSLAVLGLAVVALLVGPAGCTDDGGGEASDTALAPATTVPLRLPTVSGPVTGGKGEVNLLSVPLQPADVGYVEEEFFVDGEATAYTAIGELSSDGAWDVEGSSTAPYATRIVVWRPEDPGDFNGTVYVEWFNVTAGFDAGFDWIQAHDMITRTGAVWVGVSAQAVGVQGGRQVGNVGTAVTTPAAGGLKAADPERYGTLTHPGDGYSYDIFTQAALAVSGDGDGVDPLEGYDVERLIGMGQSQSARFLTTYANAAQPQVLVFDALMIHARGGGAASLAVDAPRDDPAMPAVVRIREDLAQPVLILQTETELVGTYVPARQPDTDTIRLWEMAGTAHIDGFPALTDTNDGRAEFTVLDPAQATGGPVNCSTPVNAGIQQPIVQAALFGLDAWVRDGTALPRFDRIETTGTAPDVRIVRDEDGLAVGGVRSPIVEVPIAVNTGEANSGPNADYCRLFGTSRALDRAALGRLYPGGETDYVANFDAAVAEAVEAGIWLGHEADEYKAAARQIRFS
jgi:hypothetical protein